MYPPFIQHSKKLLKENDISFVFIDVGSRNGVLELGSIAEFIDAFGFEPNPTEYQKLITGKTDAQRHGIVSPSYRSLKYFPYALGKTNSRELFHITRGPGAAGMLEPNMKYLSRIRWKGRAYEKNFADDIFSVNKEIYVEVKTLEAWVKEYGMSHADYMKIDVEGSEYDVLEGAGDFLNSVGVIKCEVCFIPFRKDQKLFSDVDILLRRYGFELLKYEISPLQIGFKERTQPWSFGPTLGFPERYGQPLSCDAIYVNRRISDPKRLIAQAVVFIEKNYLDEALYILRRLVRIQKPELFQLLECYQGQWRIKFLDRLFRLGRRFIKSPQLWK